MKQQHTRKGIRAMMDKTLAFPRAAQKNGISGTVRRGRPLFSVLIPVYNHAAFLPAALDSLISQTCPNWEAVIVNDGSTDNTHAVAESYAEHDNRIHVFTQANGGTSAALNTGLRQARGEWICWLSSDDLFEPNKLEVHREAIRLHPEILFFHSGYSQLDHATNVKTPGPFEDVSDRDRQVINFFRSCWVHGNSFAAHHSIFEQLGGFVQGAYHNAQDFEMWLRISVEYEMKYLPRHTCITRIHSAQPTTQFFEAGKLDCVHACLDFLNTHRFPQLFPFLDLARPEQAHKAITETFRLYLDPLAYIHAIGYHPALLERMFEWMENDIPTNERLPLQHFCSNLLDLLLSQELPHGLRVMLHSLTSRRIHPMRYAPCNFVAIVQAIIAHGNTEEARLMKRYLAEHLLLQSAHDKMRENDLATARKLLEQANNILPFSLLIKEKLSEITHVQRKTYRPAPEYHRKSLRILLVNPPYRRFLGLSNNTFPLTFGSMATMLKEAGFEVAIYDADFDKELLGNSCCYAEMFTRQHLVIEGIRNASHPVWQEIDHVMRDFAPDVIGITAMTTKYPIVERIAACAKACNPHIMTIIGGHHPTIIAEQALQNQDIDCVVIGEGEVTFFELMQAVAQGNRHWDDIAGIIFRKDNGEIVRTATRNPIANLDTLPIPDRNLILNKDYVSDNNIISTRGCPFTCSYCGADVIWAHKQRRRSVANIMAEVRYLIDHSGSRCIAFWDDSFTCNKKHTLELMAALATVPGLTFSCLTRLDLIDEEILAALHKAGCNTILFGIESGSDRLLALMNKRMTRQQIREKTRLVTAAGISWLGFFIMGYPGETREEILDTLDFMKELDPSYAEINIFNPLPGTQTWRELESKGKVCITMDFSIHSQASTDNLFIDMPPDEFRVLSMYMAREFDAHNARNTKRGDT